MTKTRIEAVIFDKDGTLVDFDRTYTPALRSALEEICEGDTDLCRRVAEVVGYDVERHQIAARAPFRTLSNAQLVDNLAPVLGHAVGDPAALARFESLFARVVLPVVVEAVGATTLLQHLARQGVPMGVATNDGEATTHEQLVALGWSGVFESIIGYDSGHGTKPEPGMVRASVRALGVRPQQTVMVGDSAVDLLAARASNVIAVFVGDDAELTAIADITIATIGELAGALDI